MTKMTAYEMASKRGEGFLANVILTQHSNPSRKLKGLVQLLESRHSVTIGHATDILLIDGERSDWALLESPVLVDRWR